MTDAEVLRRAVLILRRRTKRPKSITLNVLCNVLNDTADKVELETARHPQQPVPPRRPESGITG